MLVCARCHQPLCESYIGAIGKHWHDSCFICELCKQKFSLTELYVEHNGRAYHKNCYANKFLPRCQYCSEPIYGSYLEDKWGYRYCAKHQNELVTCPYCGKLSHQIEIGALRLQNQDYRCSSCHASSINSLFEGQPIFTLLFQWINQQGLLYGNSRVKLGIVNSQELIDRSHNTNKYILGQTQVSMQINDLQRIVNMDISVLILRGLPSTLFQGVAVHELAHAWLKAHHIININIADEEGFCELLSYRYYQSHLSLEARHYMKQIENNLDGVYGDGFRKIYNLSRRIGFTSLVNRIVNSGSFS